MEELVKMINKLRVEFDKEQQVQKCKHRPHYVLDPDNNLSLEETHKYFEYIMKALRNLSIDAIDKIDKKWLESAARNREIFADAKGKILKRWTELIFEKWGSENNKNEIVYQLENLTLSFWRASAERKGKIIFFPEIHIEVVPFLQSLRVVQNYERHTNELHEEFLYQYVEPDEEVEPYDEQVPDIFVENKKVAKKKLKKKTAKKGLTNTIEMALKTGDKKKKKQAHLSQRTLLSRSPSLKRGEHIRFNLYSDVTPIFKKSASKERATDGTEHKIDFGTEAFLGPIYHISSFESERKSQKYGSWSITLDVGLEERKLNGESILVSLKVPVEEVFLGSNEPVVAFRDESSDDWKKGVFTTHSQFDQNTFIVTTRLSKMGYVSLFQHNDFHYPYKSWKISFEKEKIYFKLHTNVVELAFVVEDSYFYLDTLTGDEFSKLRNLHQRKMSLSELVMKLEKHGVHIIPNKDIIKKHRDTKKDLDLEIFTYRLICLNQINCESCRMNATVSVETVVLTVDGAPRNITTKSPGKYVVNFGEAGKKSKLHESIVTPATLFQFLMVTRPLIVTK
ncbi:Protein CBG15421 [Caenorhabditis briggsae]|uniref:Protein CBG15421 n=1 Tax=Caenorhabditis briggsae TaxID=6238 RepID=A8XMB2_CAEBR|nr:Protein CBG15421 [Caenorhabditis briggsae]CAP33787.2 Protein CBG15421 [Caenorhabditis briggsae]